MVWAERRRLLVESSLRRQQQRQAKAERERPALEAAQRRDAQFEHRWRVFQAQFRQQGHQSDLPF